MKKILIIGMIIFTGVAGIILVNFREKEQENMGTVNYPRWGLTEENYNYRLSKIKDDEMLNNADKLLNNELVVFDSLESLPYNLESLDWDIKYTSSPNTFQLYLQSLNVLEYLGKAYEMTLDEKYLELGKNFLREWDKYRKMESSLSNPFVWYDHGTALRANNIIYFVLAAESNKLYFSDEEVKWITKLIEEHGEFLAEEKNYTENHNHGIFQDQSLLYIAYFLNNDRKKEWINLAVERLEKQKDFAFSEEMVHVENSPGYQVGIMDLFRVIAEFLTYFGNDEGNVLYADVKKSAEFMAYITKPNSVIAEIGDTSGTLKREVNADTKLTLFENEHLKYAATLGKSGIKPLENSLILPKSGYYLSRNDWSKSNIKDATWMMFKSGYSSATHKHADDNSFMLYSKGYDIFVDTGWYNYLPGNPYRQYFISANAHNTVVVDGKTYSPTAENSSKTGIYSHEKTDNYDYVLGSNEMYEGVSFDRHFYNLGDAIIIHDDLESKSEHVYSQLFHLSKDMDIILQTDHELALAIGKENSEYIVRIKWLNGNGELTRVRGGDGNSKYGYISKDLNHLDTIDTIKYDVKGKNEEIITLITIENQDKKIQDISNISFDKDNKQFFIDKENSEQYKIRLKNRKRINLEDLRINKKIEKNTFNFEIENTTNLLNDNVYAWYVVDKESASAVYKTDFNESLSVSGEFPNKKDYLVKLYAKSKNGIVRKSRIIMEITYDEETDEYIISNDNGNGLNLIYNGHSYEKIDDKLFKFNLDIHYDWKYRVKWYIYKNGGYYTNFTNINESSMEYTFNEPGVYTVMYYLTTLNGNNEFWSFKEFEIR